MTLTIISFLIILLTFVFKEILRERLKAIKEGVASAESLHQNDRNHSILRLQLAQMELELRTAQGKSVVAKAKRTQNFSKIIKADLVSITKRRNELRMEEQSTERLLKPLPRGARELRKAFEKLKEEVNQISNASVEIEKSLARKDWSQSALVKVKVMELLVMQIKILVFSGQVLTYATSAQDAAEYLYRLCTWISYVLYFLGISLALYANLAGIKHIMGAE